MLENLKPTGGAEECKVQRVRNSFDAKDQALFDGYLADRSFTAEPMSNALRERGIVLGASVIRRHRRGECICSTT
jgi:hypothetical protein